MRRLLALTTIIIFILAASPCWPEIPHLINYQGMLTDDAGLPLDGIYKLEFNIYNAPTGGIALWTESHLGIEVEKGLFIVALGKFTSIPDSVFDGPQRYLGIKVDTHPELSPRIQLTSTGFSFRAEKSDTSDYSFQTLRADTADYALATSAVESDSDWTISGNDIYSAVSGSVGIGTSSPAEKLDVVGTAQITGFKMPSGATAGHVLTSDGDGAGTWQAATADTDWTISGIDIYSGVSGNVGIGTTSPAQKLDVAGTAQMTGFKMPSGATAGHILTSDGDGAGTWQAATADTDWTISGIDIYSGVSGNVGIGTTSPAQKLDVTGTAQMTGFKMPSGATAGHILTSDGDGLGTWQAATADTDWTTSGSDIYSGVSGNVGIGTTSPAQKLDVAGTAQMTGFKMPSGATAGHILTSDGDGVGTWQATGAGADIDWTLNITDTADTTLTTGGAWGIARYGNILYGNADSTHVNLGVTCTTGTSGEDNKYCTVGGGLHNAASDWYATSGGGSYNTASSYYAAVGGGESNTASDWHATVGGGENNTASNDAATIAGGSYNTVSQRYATVGGGQGNTASQRYATIGGGLSNSASDTAATVAGGKENQASGYYATVPGGYADTAAGEYSLAAGHKVRVASDADYTFAFGRDFTTSTANAVIFYHNTGSTDSTKVGINKTDPQYGIDLPNVDSNYGKGRANAWTTYSSRRWKENINPIENALGKVLALRGVYFDWSESKNHDLGMIAEEVGEVVPEVVDYEENGIDAQSLNYARLTALLVEAIKEQQKEIELLKAKINTLENDKR